MTAQETEKRQRDERINDAVDVYRDRGLLLMDAAAMVAHDAEADKNHAARSVSGARGPLKAGTIKVLCVDVQARRHWAAMRHRFLTG